MMYMRATMTTLILLTTLSAFAAPSRELRDYYSSLSCPALDTLYNQRNWKQTRHVEWMSEHCAGDKELYVPVCKSMSSLLLEELAETGVLESVLSKKCGGVDEP